jgi:hypothetical protein
MNADRLIALIEQAGGTVELTCNHRIHYRLPKDLACLAEALCSAKEQIRIMLRDRHNAARPRRAPKQAAPVAEPIFLTAACTCSKYPFAHVHAPERNLKVERMPGDELFRWLMELVTAGRKTASDIDPIGSGRNGKAV